MFALRSHATAVRQARQIMPNRTARAPTRRAPPPFPSPDATVWVAWRDRNGSAPGSARQRHPGNRGGGGGRGGAPVRAEGSEQGGGNPATGPDAGKTDDLAAGALQQAHDLAG